ncbi:hypothetical protein Daesc_000209 [Daldinia eschscholtzii]|uniref:Uncharacterized protein n=1 Tax=Daldinia eschscholtzii TaxID=292717 RepID=A0AAX6MY46_9PEZI
MASEPSFTRDRRLQSRRSRPYGSGADINGAFPVLFTAEKDAHLITLLDLGREMRPTRMAGKGQGMGMGKAWQWSLKAARARISELRMKRYAWEA